MKNNHEKINATKVRELAPEQYWAGAIKYNCDEQELIKALQKSAQEENFTYSGYCIYTYHQDVYANTTKPTKMYVFTRYPRRAFGGPDSIEKHQSALNTLCKNLNCTGGEYESDTERFNRDFNNNKNHNVRVLLGLEEGYDNYKKKDIITLIDNGTITQLDKAIQKTREMISDTSKLQLDKLGTLEELKTKLISQDLAKIHTIKEVKEILQYDKSKEIVLTPAKILSVGTWGTYTEKAVVIEAPISELDKIYNLATQFKQARIAVEDLKERKSYMVETIYCNDPDKE